ncbi:GAF domain-containing protein [Natronomonas marina]|jgi:PAS domain S-box-containing protein|uniref:GAF domain-containing protein n=1 Tax=Natronomonas marina TaxID=2961939 RepID=UPI0020C9EEC5|nr:GAF domain-containing protein [Natronomonas marina]
MNGDASAVLFGDGDAAGLGGADGVRLRTVDDVEAGLEAVDEAPPDCVVCVAGVVEPFGLLGRVRERVPGLPFVVVTADHDPDLAVRASRSDRVEYLPRSHAENGELAERIRVLADETGVVRTHNRALVRLQEILADEEADFGESVDRLLALGCEYLGTDIAFLSAIDRDDERFDIEHAVGGHELIAPGATDSLSNTYCRRAIDGEGLLGVADTTVDEGWTGDPAYQRYELGCYIGGRIDVDGDLYGTLCFADEEPRDRTFAHREEAFVELLVEWVQEELERRAYESELGAAREDLRRMLGRIGEGFLSLDDEWRVTHLNERGEAFLGRSADELLGENLWEAFPEATDERFYEEYHRAMETQEPVTFEERHEPLDQWFEVRAYPASDGLSVFFRDVTEVKDRRRKLRRSRERYRTLAENLPNSAVLLVDENRRFQLARGGGLEDTSFVPEDFEGKPVTEALDELADMAVELVDATFDGESVRTEFAMAGNDYQLRTAPVEDETGEVFAATAVVSEITDIRERERAVREVYEVIADSDRSFDGKVEALLEIGCERLGTDYGSLSEIDGEEYHFQVVQAPPGTIEAGDTVALSATNCERTAATEETLVLSDVADEAPELTEKAGYTEWGIACYLGAPVFDGDGVHGTFCFYDDEPRREPFSEWETTLVDLMSQWVSYELQRGERERELERYESVLETVRNPIYAVDESLRFRLVTEPLAMALGYDREDLTGRPVADVLDGASADAFEAAVADLRSGEAEATVFQGEAVTADGGSYPLEVGVSVPDEAGGFVGSMRDITARRERKRDLKFFYELVSAAGVGVVAIDELGRLEYLNDACAELLGDPPEGAAADIGDVIADGAFAGHESVWEEVGFEGYEAVWDRVGFDETTAIEATADGDGAGAPVELRLTKQAIEGEPYLFGTVVDISERKETAEIRRTLSETAGAMLESGGRAETYQRALEAGRVITGFPAGAVYRFDDDRGALVPETATPELEAVAGDLPTLSGGESVTWQSFVEGRIRVLEDVSGHGLLDGDDHPFHSGLFVPLGEHGVVAFLSREPRTVSEKQRDALEILAANVEGDLDRTLREQALEARERELEERTERLQRLNRVNSVVRSIAAVVVQESDRDGIKQAVPERLVGVEPFSFVWVGDDGPTGPSAEAWAGEPTAFDDPAEEAGDGHPAVRAASTGEVQFARNLVTVPESERAVWQAAALERGYPACCAVPLVYEGTTRGVLTVYADRVGVFDDSMVELLAELGEMIGYALTAAERRAALESERTVELTFDVDGGTAATRLAEHLGCTVELKRVRNEGDTTAVTYLLSDVDEAALSEVEAALPGGTTVATTELDDGTALVEVTFGGEWVGSSFAAEGGRVETASADPDGGELVATVPLGIEVRPIVESVRESYPGVELVAKRERERSPETKTMLRGGVEERLTDKQLDVLETAYLAGFFDQPRQSSGSDVADLLDVSQPTFNQQRRAAERKLVEFLVDER